MPALAYLSDNLDNIEILCIMCVRVIIAKAAGLVQAFSLLYNIVAKDKRLNRLRNLTVRLIFKVLDKIRAGPTCVWVLPN